MKKNVKTNVLNILYKQTQQWLEIFPAIFIYYKLTK